MTSVLKRVTAAVLKIGKNDPLPNAPIADPGNSGEVADAAHVHRTPRISEAFWHTSISYGTVNTKIVKYSNEVIPCNNEVVTIVNSPTDGFSITANTKCKVHFIFNAVFNPASHFGISKNSSQLTTDIPGVNLDNVMAYCTTSDAGHGGQAVFCGILEAGDVLRPHACGTNFVNAGLYNSVQVLAEEIL